MAAMKEAANGATFLDRMRDVPATLDQLEKWNVENGHFLEGRMDASFGTTPIAMMKVSSLETTSSLSKNITDQIAANMIQIFGSGVTPMGGTLRLA